MDPRVSVMNRSRQTLKVREHSVLGPYVDGLSKLAVTSYKVTAFSIEAASTYGRFDLLHIFIF